MRPSTPSAFPLLLITFLSLMGCSKPDLVVVDAVGNPIEGAKIVGTSLSISGQSSYSDKNGHANIPRAVQQTKWISVYKQEYQSVEHIDASQKKPIVVKMAKPNG